MNALEQARSQFEEVYALGSQMLRSGFSLRDMDCGTFRICHFCGRMMFRGPRVDPRYLRVCVSCDKELRGGAA